MKCSIVDCKNEAIIRNEEEKYLQCCSEHIDEVKEYFIEQYNKEQQELYDWWLSTQ